MLVKVRTNVAKSVILLMSILAAAVEINASCEHYVNGETGTLHSPNYDYTHEACTWTITVDNGYFIKLEFQTYNVESDSSCHSGVVEVFDVQSYFTRNLKDSWCLKDLPPTIVLTTSKVEIEITPNWFGFFEKISVSWNKIGSCGNFNTDHGTFHSLNYPSNYKNNDGCTWVISVDHGYFIKLEFNSPFRLENDCSHDYVKVFNVWPFGSRYLNGTWCGTNLPPTFRSSTSKVNVEFKSDGSGSYTGFSASWNQIGSVSCGGKFNTDNGTLHSPNYPLYYNNNDYCMWTISVNDGYRIKLKFATPFGLETSSYGDNIKVYDVLSSDRRILREIWYGSNLPQPLVSSTTTIDVVFKSNRQYRGIGFSASWGTTGVSCGDNFNTDQGTLHSPNYPSSYNNNDHCMWSISVDDGFRITLEFNAPFSLGGTCNHDNVKVFDVLSSGRRKLRGTWCGSNLPRTLVSTTPTIMVVFKSDGHDVNTGFSASWRKTASSCGGYYNIDHGTLHSPNYSSSYNNYDFCAWTISVDDGYRITLGFNAPFRLEGTCGLDNVKVFDVLSNGRRNLTGTWCGSILPAPLVSTTSTIEVVFKSDGYNVDTGFSAFWRKTAAICGGNFNRDQGTLHSPNYPSYYNNDDYCTWTISVEDGNRITLESNAPFRLNGTCYADNVQVYDVLSNGGRNLRGTWCSSHLPSPLVSSTSRIEVVFESDGNYVDTGFSASWKKTAVSCGGIFNRNHETFHSPNYPSRYNNGDYCIWTISVENGYRILLEFNAPFSLENACHDDNVKVYDVLPNGRRNLTHTLCGSHRPLPLVSTTSMIEVVFKSEGTFVDTGFSASWSKIVEGGTSEISEEAVLIVCASVVVEVISIAMVLINESFRSNRRARVHCTAIPLPHRVNQYPFPEMPHTQPSGPPPSYEEAVNDTYM